jgi:ribose transport system permease protein
LPTACYQLRDCPEKSPKFDDGRHRRLYPNCCESFHDPGGRTIYAIGSNREAARTAGLNVLAFSILPYVISGGLSAVAITFASAQVRSIDPLGGTGLELDAIAAVVIGGASLYGGRGSIVGTLIGVLIMVMIRNGLNLLNV